MSTDERRRSVGLAIQVVLTLALFACLVMLSPWVAGAAACAIGITAVEVLT
jgi:hypothetical protein